MPPGIARGDQNVDEKDRKAAERRTREANEAAWGCNLRLSLERGYMKAHVTGMDKDTALEVRKRFQRYGWSATCKNRYTEVCAERKI